MRTIGLFTSDLAGFYERPRRFPNLRGLVCVVKKINTKKRRIEEFVRLVSVAIRLMVYCDVMQDQIQAAMQFNELDLECNRNGKLSARQRRPFLIRFTVSCLLLAGVVSTLLLLLFNPALFNWHGSFSRYLEPISGERVWAGEMIIWSLWAGCLIVLIRHQHRGLAGGVKKLHGKIRLRRSKWFIRSRNPTGCAIVIKQRTFLISPVAFDLLTEGQICTAYYLSSVGTLLSLEAKV